MFLAVTRTKHSVTKQISVFQITVAKAERRKPFSAPLVREKWSLCLTSLLHFLFLFFCCSPTSHFVKIIWCNCSHWPSFLAKKLRYNGNTVKETTHFSWLSSNKARHEQSDIKMLKTQGSRDWISHVSLLWWRPLWAANSEFVLRNL